MPYSAMENLELLAQRRERAEELLRRACKQKDEDAKIAENTKDFWKHQNVD